MPYAIGVVIFLGVQAGISTVCLRTFGPNALYRFCYYSVIMCVVVFCSTYLIPAVLNVFLLAHNNMDKRRHVKSMLAAEKVEFDTETRDKIFATIQELMRLANASSFGGNLLMLSTAADEAMNRLSRHGIAKRHFQNEAIRSQASEVISRFSRDPERNRSIISRIRRTFFLDGEA